MDPFSTSPPTPTYAVSKPKLKVADSKEISLKFLNLELHYTHVSNPLNPNTRSLCNKIPFSTPASPFGPKFSIVSEINRPVFNRFHQAAPGIVATRLRGRSPDLSAAALASAASPKQAKEMSNVRGMLRNDNNFSYVTKIPQERPLFSLKTNLWTDFSN
jgi:hypothetical protein